VLIQRNMGRSGYWAGPRVERVEYVKA